MNVSENKPPKIFGNRVELIGTDTMIDLLKRKKNETK